MASAQKGFGDGQYEVCVQQAQGRRQPGAAAEKHAVEAAIAAIVAAAAAVAAAAGVAVAAAPCWAVKSVRSVV